MLHLIDIFFLFHLNLINLCDFVLQQLKFSLRDIEITKISASTKRQIIKIIRGKKLTAFIYYRSCICHSNTHWQFLDTPHKDAGLTRLSATRTRCKREESTRTLHHTEN